MHQHMKTPAKLSEDRLEITEDRLEVSEDRLEKVRTA